MANFRIQHSVQLLTYLTLPVQRASATDLFCVYAQTRQPGKSPGFMPGAEGSLPCNPLQRRGKWRRGEGKQTHKRWYDLSRELACICSISWVQLVGYVYFKSIWHRNNSPFMRKSVWEGWVVVKRKVFYCFVCLYIFQSASPDSHQQSEQNCSEPSSAEHLAIKAKIKATHPNKREQSPTPIKSFPIPKLWCAWRYSNTSNANKEMQILARVPCSCLQSSQRAQTLLPALLYAFITLRCTMPVSVDACYPAPSLWAE